MSQRLRDLKNRLEKLKNKVENLKPSENLSQSQDEVEEIDQDIQHVEEAIKDIEDEAEEDERSGRRNGRTEAARSDGLGRSDEQHPKPCRGDREERTDHLLKQRHMIGKRSACKPPIFSENMQLSSKVV